MVPTTASSKKIAPAAVRYIKLGQNGKWEQECLKKGIIRLGFGSATDERFALCQEGQWKELRDSFLMEGKTQGTATRFANETRLFFTDEGSTLWLTFIGEQMWWGFVNEAPAQKHADGDGVWRTIVGGWKCTDLSGVKLSKDRLSGGLTQLAAYRGTSCKTEYADYAVRRINAQKTPELELAVNAIAEIKRAIIALMKLLGWQDFEMLVDLVFSNAGWRRQGVVGKTQKSIDLDLLMPVTGERVFVQVKSKTNSQEVAEYASKIDELGNYDRMFFAYHTGKVELGSDERIIILGPEKLADMVLDAGLVDWLVRKVS